MYVLPLFWSHSMPRPLCHAPYVMPPPPPVPMQELAGLDESSQPSVESSSPEQCLSKLTALIRVFTTVLISLGTNFSPSRNAQITPGFVKMVHVWIVCVCVGGGGGGVLVPCTHS